jgi:hypothetical protein
MALQLVVPSLPARVRRLEVRRWLKQPGDDIVFGDEICELEVREFLSVNRADPSTGDEGRQAVITSSAAGVLVMVTASDAGRLVEASAAPGELVEVGSLLGRVEHLGGGVAADAASHLTFHAVADVVGSREVSHREVARTRTPKQRVLNLYRRALGRDTRLERALRARRGPVKTASPASSVRQTGTHMTTRHDDGLIVESLAEREPRWGVHLVGGCDLAALLEADLDVVRDVRGTMVVQRASVRISGARSDVLLQTLEAHDPGAIAEVTEALSLPRDYFSPVAFVPTFVVPGSDLGAVPVTITVLSAGADVVRPAYRHKEHGLIIDPGGYWLDGEMLSNERQRQFRSYLAAKFDRIGKLSIDEHRDNFRRLVPELRERTGGDVLVTNVLTIEPGDRTHNYQLRKVPEGARRRQFHIAQAELSAELGYHVVDVDRALKRSRIAGQVDFAHFPREQYPAVAGEAYAALRQAGLL